MVCRLFQNYLYGNNTNNNRYRAMASIIPTRYLFAPTWSAEKSTRFLSKIDPVFVKNRLGFCKKSTRFFFLHRLDPLKNRLGFFRAPTRSAEKSTRFFSCTDSTRWKNRLGFFSCTDSIRWKSTRFWSCTDSVRWKIDSVLFVLHWPCPQCRSFLNNANCYLHASYCLAFQLAKMADEGVCA